MKSALTIIALGANVASVAGKPQETLEISLKLINLREIDVIRVSSWWRSPAFPAESGDDFVNGVALANSSVEPAQMLQILHDVEAELGRTRDRRWEPRVCDLDLIAYGDAVAPDKAEVSRLMALGLAAGREPPPDQLVLPHPRMHERSFVLAPMAEVAPEWRHPLLGLTTAELLAALPAERLQGLERL